MNAVTLCLGMAGNMLQIECPLTKYQNKDNDGETRPCFFGCVPLGESGSLISLCIKGTDKSMTRVDSTVPLMYHDPRGLKSLIPSQITLKECKFYIREPPQTHAYMSRHNVVTNFGMLPTTCPRFSLIGS